MEMEKSGCILEILEVESVRLGKEFAVWSKVEGSARFLF